MKATILEGLFFKVDLDQLKKNLRIKVGTEMEGKIEGMAREAQKIARPKACYRVVFVESKGDDHLLIEETRFTSRILRINLDKVYRVFPFVATCGLELEEWSKSVTGRLEQFWAEEIKVMAVREAIRYLRDNLLEYYQLGQISRMNPGSLPDWPLSEQKPLSTLMGSGPETIGVQLKDNFLMTPLKSISGIWFPTEEKFESCQLCRRKKCPARRAPFDQSLFERRYH